MGQRRPSHDLGARSRKFELNRKPWDWDCWSSARSPSSWHGDCYLSREARKVPRASCPAAWPSIEGKSLTGLRSSGGTRRPWHAATNQRASLRAAGCTGTLQIAAIGARRQRVPERRGSTENAHGHPTGDLGARWAQALAMLDVGSGAGPGGRPPRFQLAGLGRASPRADLGPGDGPGRNSGADPKRAHDGTGR